MPKETRRIAYLLLLMLFSFPPLNASQDNTRGALLFEDGFEPKFCTLTYRLNNSRFFIRDSSGGLYDTEIDGDGTETGPITGFVVIRTLAEGGIPKDGIAEILQFELQQSFTFSDIVTEVIDSAGDGNSVVAIGALTTGATNQLVFTSCALPAGTDVDNPDYTQASSYTPDDIGTGSGCLTPYHSFGTVTCNGTSFSCGLYNLNQGANDRDEIWEQPLNEISLSGDYMSLTMSETGTYSRTIDSSGSMAIPNRTPSTTWMHWAGSLDTLVCD